MKKKIVILSFLALSLSGWAQEASMPSSTEGKGSSETKTSSAELAYEAGFDVVTAYLWRGLYNGGLSFQPTASVGCDHEHVQFSIGVWASVGATDWKCQTGLPKTEGYNPNTYFKPEVDMTVSLRSHGVTLGFSHYYYCQGNYFSFGDIESVIDNGNSSQTEVSIGIDGDDWLPEQHHTYLNWYTMVSGLDYNYDLNEDEEEINITRAYSSYLELGYDYTFQDIGLTLGGQLGIVPWRSNWTYNTHKAALQCISLKLNKAWTFNVCEIDVYAQGMLNTADLNSENAYINAAGDDKLCYQKLNGLIGLGIWF